MNTVMKYKIGNNIDTVYEQLGMGKIIFAYELYKGGTSKFLVSFSWLYTIKDAFFEYFSFLIKI